VKQFLWLLFVIVVIIGGYIGGCGLSYYYPQWRWCVAVPWAVVSITLGWNAYAWSPDGRRMARKRKEFQAYLDSIKDEWIEE
jgi:hypothetical protein